MLSVSGIPFRIVFHPASVFHAGVPNFDAYDFGPKGPACSSAASRTAIGSRTPWDRQKACSCGPRLQRRREEHSQRRPGHSRPEDNILILIELSHRSGELKTITQEQARVASETMHDPERPWRAWVASVKKNMPDMR